MDYIHLYLYYFPILHICPQSVLFSDSIFGGRAAVDLLKRLGEIAHLLKTAALRNRRYLICGKLQFQRRLLETIGFQVSNGRRIDRRVKTPNALAGADRAGGGDILYRKLPVVICLNKSQHFLDSRTVTLFFSKGFLTDSRLVFREQRHNRR